jgi:5,10-methylenetetrahydromethanopterin reductase
MTMKISCAFGPSPQTHEHIRIAESLGYERAFCYDSAALYLDVWVQLCRAAERTERIGLGPGVLIPSLRHPMTTAAAIATLVSIAGEQRVSIGVGTGFTGRLTMGQRPLRWAYVSDYIEVVQALLRGEEVDWEGAPMQMMHPAGIAAPRPIRVPFVIGAAGEKGIAVAHRLGDGVFGAPAPVPGFGWSIVLAWGTVLEDGEDPGSERAMAAAGHGAAVFMHWALEHNRLDLVPDAERWQAAYADVPERSRHLAVHAGHLAEINDHDRPFVTGELLAAGKLALSPGGWRERVAELEAAGATEIAYQPAGPDIPRELEAFAVAVSG